MSHNQRQRIFLNLCTILICCCVPTFGRSLQTEAVNTQLLTTIKSYMNSSENPCEDFYDYACGNWMNSNGHVEELKIGDVPSSLNYMYSQELMQMLEGDVKSDKPETKEIFNKLKDFYESCKKQENFNINHYLDIIKPTDQDDWPLDGESWNPTEKWSVWSTMGKLARYGFNNLFFDFHIELGKDLKYYWAYWQSYELQFDQLMFVQNQVYDTTEKKVIGMLEKVVEFMDQVRKLYYEFHKNESGKLRTDMRGLKKSFKDMDLYVLAYMGPEKVDQVEAIAVDIQSYLNKLLELIEDTPQDVLIHAVKQSFRFYLSKQMPAQKSAIACVEPLRELVPLAVDYMYGQEIYTHKNVETEAVIEKIFEAMKVKLSSIITNEHNDLPGEEVADFKEKSLNVKLNFGNLPHGVDDHFYVAYFQGWEVLKNDFYLNHLNALKRKYFDALELAKSEEFQQLLKFSGQAETMPSYLYTSNVVVIPFAYIHSQMIQPKFNELFLYAELGNTVARAMMRGFEQNGVRYDKDGNLYARCRGDYTRSCVTYRRKSKIGSGASCLRQKYNLNYSEVDQSIADVSGFRLAYDTYFQASEDSKYAADSEFSKKQLFVIKFAQRFCINPNLNYDNTHGLPQTRVSRILENHLEFDKIFSCPLKADADVLKKCQVW